MSRRSVAALVLALALGVAGCGGDEGGGGGASGGSGGGGGGGNETTTLKVGVIPIADVAPLYLGIEKGFFKQQNLDIQPQLAAGGAAIVPAVVSGSNQIGFSNTVSELIASSKGLPIRIVSQGVLGADSQKDAWSKVLVKKGSPIKSAKDLAGKTIAVNTLNNIGDVTIKATLESMGVDPSSIKFVEVGFPDMPSALQSGRVDAVWEVEPFVTAIEAQGGRGIIAPYIGTAPNLTVATYFASQKYIDENPDVVDAFVKAINQSLDYAQSHPDEVRQIVTTYTKIPPQAAKTMKLPQWSSDLSTDTISKLAELSQKYGLIQEPPDLSQLIRSSQG